MKNLASKLRKIVKCNKSTNINLVRGFYKKEQYTACIFAKNFVITINFATSKYPKTHPLYKNFLHSFKHLLSVFPNKDCQLSDELGIPNKGYTLPCKLIMVS